MWSEGDIFCEVQQCRIRIFDWELSSLDFRFDIDAICLTCYIPGWLVEASRWIPVVSRDIFHDSRHICPVWRDHLPPYVHTNPSISLRLSGRGGSMASSDSKVEKIQTHFQVLSNAASQLNAASDELTRVIGVLDEALKKLNVGLTVWVTF